MAVTKGKISWGGVIEHWFIGTSGDNLNEFILASNTHLKIVEINFNVVGTGVATEDFLGKKDHSQGATQLDQEFIQEDMAGKPGVLQSFDKGIHISDGSKGVFTWTNTDTLAWGLSVFVEEV